MSTPVAAPSFAHPGHLFIGGQWKAPSTGGLIDVTAPFNEQVFASVGEARAADIDLAVAAARHAFDEGPWPRLHPTQRAAYLLDIATHMERRAAEFAAAYTNQVGMPHHIATMAFGGAVAMVRYFAGLAEIFPFEDQRPSPQGGIAMVVREPVGVAVCIAPWNAPLHTMLLKVIPALLAGCTVIAKPSPETPLDALILAECAEAAAIPDGVLSVLTAGREASDYLMRHDDVDKVSFTGSTSVGKHIAAVCGARMARVTMELGGKSAAIVLDDIPIDQVIPALMPHIVLLAGQQCAALGRILVSRKRRDEVVEAVAAAMRHVTVGDPYDTATTMGPLIAQRQLDRVNGYVVQGQREGARLVTGGNRPHNLNSGFFIEPTLFTNADNSMAICREEIFGPVAAVITYDSEEEAIRIANDSPYGLSGAIYTQDTDHAYAIARRIRSGNLTQNGRIIDFTLPYGGFKFSGVGREGGAEGVEAFTETKTVFLARAPERKEALLS
jgi:aldehyde dehydrogenase (NAD+)